MNEQLAVVTLNRRVCQLYSAHPLYHLRCFGGEPGEHPELVKQAISLDSLRMYFPRSGKVPILSLRANDTEADPGVLPPKKVNKKAKITIISLKEAKHIDLCDRGSENIRKEFNEII
ncbi:MAG: hypothetical protein H0U73_00470 [Tatlockia sp.]|nr:hypothetical protein [Tatlockia sp.]